MTYLFDGYPHERVATCTLPQAYQSVCTAILNEFLALYTLKPVSFLKAITTPKSRHQPLRLLRKVQNEETQTKVRENDPDLVPFP